MAAPKKDGSAKKRPAEDRKPFKTTPNKKQKVPGGASKPSKHAKPAPPANLTRKEKKELAREKKAKRQKNFNLIQEVVTLWEDLRRHDISPEKRSKLITAVLAKVKGRVAELAASHTASRVIQACVKYGTPAERAAILEEVSPKLLDLSKNAYAHFMVRRLIALAPKEQLPGILKHFRGQIPSLLRHPVGAHIVDELYTAADPKQRNAMAAEFYGREYVLFEGGTINNASGAPARLGDLLSKVDGAKRRSVIQHISKDLIPIMEKGLLDPPLVHRLVSEFLEWSPASLVADAVESLCGEPLLHMVHTQHGARAACMALAYGTAKDRKKAVKALKGHVCTMARDEWGHLVLITALSVVDDTALLKKFVVAELQKELAELCTDRYGHRVLLQLLHPYCGRYLPPQLAAVALPPVKEYTAAAAGAAQGAPGGQEAAGQAAAGRAESDDEEDEEGGASARPTSGPLGVSKKDSATRRRELFGSGPTGLGGALCTLCASRSGELLRSQAACDIVVEVCHGGEGGLLAECAGEEAVAAVHEAVAAAVAEGAAAGEGKEPLLVHYFGSRALRRLVLSSAAPAAGAEQVAGAAEALAARCAEALWAEGGLRGSCSSWVGGHAAKVLAALVKCGSESVRREAAKELGPLVAPQKVDEWAERFAAPAGGQQQPGDKKAKGKGKRKQGGDGSGSSGGQQQQEQQQPAAAPLRRSQRGQQGTAQQQQEQQQAKGKQAAGKQPAKKQRK